MGVLFDSNLYSLTTVIGFVWTLAVFFLLYTKKGAEISSNKWLLLVTFPAAYVAVPMVAADVDALTQLAGGVATLDGHIGYSSADITEFAIALGEAGRVEYALFQLGMDTLAPPAFAGVLISVVRGTVAFDRVKKILVVLVSVYFLSVLFANALMPVYMLNYPAEDNLSALLFVLLPALDGIKYGTHAVVWLAIISSWCIWLVSKYFSKPPVEAAQ
ncbi:hypothetical protein R50073_01490 [Maricurvus nonylphenolicus]|uniref:hypothetical protein n=1 Tax=Maricurvus nonylphenolicus TaxID=1008307 RepID=UPI0036F19C2D